MYPVPRAFTIASNLNRQYLKKVQRRCRVHNPRYNTILRPTPPYRSPKCCVSNCICFIIWYGLHPHGVLCIPSLTVIITMYYLLLMSRYRVRLTFLFYWIVAFMSTPPGTWSRQTPASLGPTASPTTHPVLLLVQPSCFRFFYQGWFKC